MRKRITRLLALLLTVALMTGQTQTASMPVRAAEDDGGAYAENSFRYEDGRPVAELSGSLRGASANTWEKVDGTYLNSKNEEIPGAVKRGIDVSKWQGDIDWEEVKESDIGFAIIKCGSINPKTGRTVDPKWYQNADECKRLGIPFGVYIYSYADTTAKAKKEAQYVLKLIKGYRLRYPVYLDMEDKKLAKLSKKQLANIAKAFCSTIESAGYEAGIYANYNWFTKKLTDSYFDTKDRWCARYNTYCGLENVGKSYNVWQCTSSFKVSGIKGRVDLNFQIGKVPPAQVRSVKVSASSARLSVGGSKKLSVSKILPLNAYNKSVRWSSSNKAVATVSSNGTVKAVGPGAAKITARAADGSGKKAVCTVKVSGKAVEKTDPAEESNPSQDSDPVDNPGTEISGFDRTNGAVSVSWKQAAGADGYMLYYSTDNETFAAAAFVDASILSYNMAGLTSGRTYYFKVCTWKNTGGVLSYGPMSEEKSIYI